MKKKNALGALNTEDQNNYNDLWNKVKVVTKRRKNKTYDDINQAYQAILEIKNKGKGYLLALEKNKLLFTIAGIDTLYHDKDKDRILELKSKMIDLLLQVPEVKENNVDWHALTTPIINNHEIETLKIILEVLKSKKILNIEAIINKLFENFFLFQTDIMHKNRNDVLSILFNQYLSETISTLKKVNDNFFTFLTNSNNLGNINILSVNNQISELAKKILEITTQNNSLQIDAFRAIALYFAHNEFKPEQYVLADTEQSLIIIACYFIQHHNSSNVILQDKFTRLLNLFNYSKEDFLLWIESNSSKIIKFAFKDLIHNNNDAMFEYFINGKVNDVDDFIKFTVDKLQKTPRNMVLIGKELAVIEHFLLKNAIDLKPQTFDSLLEIRHENLRTIFDRLFTQDPSIVNQVFNAIPQEVFNKLIERYLPWVLGEMHTNLSPVISVEDFIKSFNNLSKSQKVMELINSPNFPEKFMNSIRNINNQLLIIDNIAKKETFAKFNELLKHDFFKKAYTINNLELAQEILEKIHGWENSPHKDQQQVITLINNYKAYIMQIIKLHPENAAHIKELYTNIKKRPIVPSINTHKASIHASSTISAKKLYAAYNHVRLPTEEMITPQFVYDNFNEISKILEKADKNALSKIAFKANECDKIFKELKDNDKQASLNNMVNESDYSLQSSFYSSIINTIGKIKKSKFVDSGSSIELKVLYESIIKGISMIGTSSSTAHIEKKDALIQLSVYLYQAGIEYGIGSPSCESGIFNGLINSQQSTLPNEITILIQNKTDASAELVNSIKKFVIGIIQSEEIHHIEAKVLEKAKENEYKASKEILTKVICDYYSIFDFKDPQEAREALENFDVLNQKIEILIGTGYTFENIFDLVDIKQIQQEFSEFNKRNRETEEETNDDDNEYGTSSSSISSDTKKPKR